MSGSKIVYEYIALKQYKTIKVQHLITHQMQCFHKLVFSNRFYIYSVYLYTS